MYPLLEYFAVLPRYSVEPLARPGWHDSAIVGSAGSDANSGSGSVPPTQRHTTWYLCYLRRFVHRHSSISISNRCRGADAVAACTWRPPRVPLPLPQAGRSPRWCCRGSATPRWPLLCAGRPAGASGGSSPSASWPGPGLTFNIRN